MNYSQCPVCTVFLSTLSLRRATKHTKGKKRKSNKFLSTLSLRRATLAMAIVYSGVVISIHALLAESDIQPHQGPGQPPISIHALLAESDLDVTIIGRTWDISIHALLAESDTARPVLMMTGPLFLSTLSLRRATVSIALSACCRHGFLSTLSLRRATSYSQHVRRPSEYFYPRSPCGERRGLWMSLAGFWAFLSTLSLRRATYWGTRSWR